MRVAELAGQVEKQFVFVEKQFACVDARFDRIEMRLDLLETDMGEVKEGLQGMDRKLDTIITTLDGLVGGVKTHRQEINFLSHRVSKHTDQIKALADHTNLKLED